MIKVALIETINQDRMRRVLSQPYFDFSIRFYSTYSFVSGGTASHFPQAKYANGGAGIIVPVPAWSGLAKDFPVAKWFNEAAKELDNCDILVFWNQDLQPYPGLFDEIVEKCQPKTRLTTSWSDIQEDKFFTRDVTWPKSRGADNWALVIRQEDFANLGGFNEEYPFWGADIDLNLRMKKAGFTTVSLDYCYLHLKHDRDYVDWEDRAYYFKKLQEEHGV